MTTINREHEHKVLCFTGHRPQSHGQLKLPGWDWHKPWSNEAVKRLGSAIMHHSENFIDTLNVQSFITGGALGVDQIAFWAIHKLKIENGYKNLKNILAIPYSDQSKVWKNPIILAWYNKAIKVADEVIYTDTLAKYSDGVIGTHTNLKLSLRDQYMVDRSDYVFAVWNGSPGGTKNCINYAQRCHKKIYVLHPTSFDFKRL